MVSAWHSRLLRLPLALLVVLLAPIPIVRSADTSPQLISSSPASGSFLSGAPSQVRATFSADLRPDGSTMSVKAPGGAEVNAGPVRLEDDHRTLVGG